MRSIRVPWILRSNRRVWKKGECCCLPAHWSPSWLTLALFLNNRIQTCFYTKRLEIRAWREMWFFFSCARTTGGIIEYTFSFFSHHSFFSSSLISYFWLESSDAVGRLRWMRVGCCWNPSPGGCNISNIVAHLWANQSSLSLSLHAFRIFKPIWAGRERKNTRCAGEMEENMTILFIKLKITRGFYAHPRHQTIQQFKSEHLYSW